MSISRDNLLIALRNGCCINTFYRTSAKLADASTFRVPDGYLLASPEEGDDAGVIMSHTEFQSIESDIIEIDKWQEIIGPALFGGSRWILRQE